MGKFTVNPNRFDPYKGFKFRVKWEGRYVLGVSKARTLNHSSELVQQREGGDPPTTRKSPGRAKYEAITLERGVTQDAEFERWANKGSGTEVSQGDFRKDIIIELYDGSDQLVLVYKVFRCWVSEYQALPDVDANAVAVESIKLENEGWERDDAVAEPAEIQFTKPP